MKAKDYAANYLKSDQKFENLVELGKSFLLEIETISNARNVKTVEGLIPICDELNKKWIRFAEIVNSKLPISNPVSYSGFKNLLSYASPELFKMWTSK